MPSPHFVIRPLCSTSPDPYIRGVRPKMAPTVWDFSNLEAMSPPVRNASAVMVSLVLQFSLKVGFENSLVGGPR